jgi:glycosyltransferase involved in cell wall biosynthesis
MLSADVFVLASRRESFGLVLIEARQAGCAIVATDVDGVAEALEGGDAGMLVPLGDVPALASALHHMLSDQQERVRWQWRAKNGITHFRVPRMASEVRAVYEEVASSQCEGVTPKAAVLK